MACGVWTHRSQTERERERRALCFCSYSYRLGRSIGSSEHDESLSRMAVLLSSATHEAKSRLGNKAWGVHSNGRLVNNVVDADERKHTSTGHGQQRTEKRIRVPLPLVYIY